MTEIVPLSQRTMVIMMGLPGSGKTSYINSYLQGAPVVSGDQLKNSKKVGQMCIHYMNKEQFLAVDATNLTLSRRKPLIDLCKAYVYNCVGIYLPRDPKLCIERIATRVSYGGEKVSRVAVYTLNSRTVKPTVEEGFDKLLVA